MILLMNVDNENPSEIEGTNTQIEGAGILDFELKGNTHQDSYTGKNLFNKYGDFTYGNNRHQTTLNELGQLVSTANFSSGRSSGLLIENLSQNTNYAFSGILISASGTGTNSNAVIEIMSTTSSVIYREHIAPSVTKPYNFSFTFNTGSNTSLWVSLSGVNSTSGGTTETVFDNLQLELGSATSYEPYVGGIPSPNPDFPQPIEVVTGTNTIKINGKNLFDLSNITTKKTFTNTGAISSLTNSFIQEIYIPVSSETDYTMSTTNDYSSETDYRLVICEYDSNKNFIKRNLGGSAVGNKYTITTSSTTKYVRLCASIVTLNELQFEENSTASDYEPYQEQSYTINLGSIELCKIGDYQDYIYKENNKWYKHSEIGKVVLDGSEEDWLLNQYGFFQVSVPNTTSNSSKRKGYSNYFKYAFNSQTDNTFFPVDSHIRFRCNTFSNVNDFKNWLSTHNTEVYYVLATPTNTEITDTNLIEQLEAISNSALFDGVNYIDLNSDNLIGSYKITYSNWYRFEKILRSGYNINEDNDRITQKFANGHRKQFVSDYKDCIITLNLDTIDIDTTKEYLRQLKSGPYKYYSLENKEYKTAQFIIEKRPELKVNNSIGDNTDIDEYQVTLLRAGD